MQAERPGKHFAEEQLLPLSTHTRNFRLALSFPANKARMRLVLPEGFTLRSDTRKPTDSSSIKGLGHWSESCLTNFRCCSPNPARFDVPAATRS